MVIDYAPCNNSYTLCGHVHVTAVHNGSLLQCSVLQHHVLVEPMALVCLAAVIRRSVAIVMLVQVGAKHKSCEDNSVWT